MITYIIIFIYAFNGCCLTYLSTINNFFRLLYNIVVLYTKLYLEYQLRLLYIIYKKKKLIILFFLFPTTKTVVTAH